MSATRRTFPPFTCPLSDDASAPAVMPSIAPVIAATVAGSSSRYWTSMLVPSASPETSSRLPRQERVDLPQEAREVDRLRVEVVAARLVGLVAVAEHRVGRERDDRDRLRRVVRLQAPRDLPAV